MVSGILLTGFAGLPMNTVVSNPGLEQDGFGFGDEAAGGGADAAAASVPDASHANGGRSPPAATPPAATPPAAMRPVRWLASASHAAPDAGFVAVMNRASEVACA